MISVDKNYWLYIAPHVYCNIKKTRVLLYNTKNGMSIESEDQIVLALLQSLHERKNLGAIYCEGKMLVKNSYKEFILQFCSKEMGNLIDVKQVPEKPIQMMPILNLQNDIDRLKNINDRDPGEEIMQYLHELSIYLHTDCKQCCYYCDDYFKQNLCCYKNEDKQYKILGVEVIESVLSQIQYGVVGKLNLLGGDLFNYPHYNRLTSLLMGFRGQVHLWNHYANFANHKFIIPDFIYNVIVSFPLNEDLWNCCLISLSRQELVKFHFYITQEDEYDQSKWLVEQYNISKYSIHPVYVKTNHVFFEEYIFLDKEDILAPIIPFSQIFAHQKLNTHFFGSLTILANGNIYANVNRDALGNIYNDKLLDIINKELLVNTAWRICRDNPPCSDCLYRYLCPSPSNYEIIIGKSNLCHVKV